MSDVALPKRGLWLGVQFLATLLLYEGSGSLTCYGLKVSLFINELIHYNLFPNYTFNIWGLILKAWFGWPIIRTAPRCYSFFLPPLGYPRRDVI